MSRVRANREYYDQISLAYDRARGGRYHELVDRLACETVQAVGARDRPALEAGCGTGRILSGLRQAGLPARGVDLSAGMLRHARARGLPVARADLTRLPVADGRLGLVCCFKVLPHVDDLGAALAELARVLAPGGHLVVEVYNPHSLRALVKRLGGPRRILAGIDEGEVATRYDSLGALRAAAPPELELRQLRGVRIFTPAARLHDLPLVGPLLGWAEARLAETSLRRIAGFLIATFRKVG